MITSIDLSKELLEIDMVKAVRSSSNHKSQACSVIGTTVWKPGFTTVEDQALVSQGEGGGGRCYLLAKEVPHF